MEENRIAGLLAETRRNATLGWIVVLGLCVLALAHAFEGSYRWFVFTGIAVAIILAPAVALRNPLVMPPWELLLVVAIPVVDATAFGHTFLTSVAVYVAVAAVALVVAVEIHRFTPARMNHSFAVVLVVIATLAVAAVWNVGQWVADVTLHTEYLAGGRSQDAANYALMIDFAYAAVAGLLAGVVFDRYVRMRSFARPPDPSAPVEAGRESRPSLVRGRLEVPDPYVRAISRVMQVALACVLLYGLVARDLSTVANASIALSLTFLPALLERDYRLPLEPELVFWLTSAVFLHALGSAGLYDVVGAWDNVTHTLSASVVAAAGYTVVRAIDLHTDEIHLPQRLMFAFILLFVLAFGVVWELAEFAIDQSAQRFGLEAVLAQYGVDDTIVDLLFDLVGGVVTAGWGAFYLADLSESVAGRFER